MDAEHVPALDPTHVGLQSITDPAAVLSAMDEFGSIGRDAFLRKYGFGPATRFFVVEEGREYDSKAILGAAHAFQFPELGPLSSRDFSGGEPTIRRLNALGFQVRDVGGGSAKPLRRFGDYKDDILPKDKYRNGATKGKYYREGSDRHIVLAALLAANGHASRDSLAADTGLSVSRVQSALRAIDTDIYLPKGVTIPGARADTGPAGAPTPISRVALESIARDTPVTESPDPSDRETTPGQITAMAVLASDVYMRQAQRHPRGRPSDRVVAAVVSFLIDCGGRCHRDAVAERVGIPPARMSGSLASLQRVLNVEAYPVLSIDPDGVTWLLDQTLLREQFGLPA